tara:strand:- start:200 stop:1288 length:1089 start_codon:yes stop_codon:yes gene_type:complete
MPSIYGERNTQEPENLSLNTDPNRKILTFYLPIVEYVDDSGEPISGSTLITNEEDGSSILKGREFKYENTGLRFYEKKFYLNPQSIGTSNKKMIQKQFTKGGYFVQYWGEELTSLAINGTTGSAGISEINKIMSIYRHEQIHFRQLSINKAKRFNKLMMDKQGGVIESALKNNNSTGDNALDALSYLDQLLLGGQVGQVVDGVNTFVENLENLAYPSNKNVKYKEIAREQSLATLATSLVMSFHGINYRGYIDGFSFSEQANEPGLFTYNFNFIVLYSSGQRNNFMPWHIEAEDESGNSRIASVPAQGTWDDIYTFEKDTQPTLPRIRTQATQQQQVSASAAADTDPDFDTSGGHQRERNSY